MIKHIFTNSFGILFSRVLGFIRDLLTASILGANIYSDIFFVAFKLPNLFRRIFAEGAFTQAFIPSFANARKKARFTSMIFMQFLFIILMLSLLVTLFSKAVTSVIAIGFDDVTTNLAAPLVAINFYYLPLIFSVTFLASLLQYKKHFATTAFSTALLNISLIISLLLANGLEKYQIAYYLSYGVVAGGVLQLLVHLVAVKKLNLFKYFVFKYKYLKNNFAQNRFYKSFYGSTLGSSVAQISAFIDTWLASLLVSGSISYLYYANRVFQLPLALFAIATSIALFPTIAKFIKNKEETKALHYLSKAFWLLFALLSTATLIGIVFAEQIIWLLFERGEFESSDTDNTYIVLVAYLIGLMPFGLSKIFSLWLYSHHKQLLAAKISAKSIAINIVLSFTLIIPLQAFGLALASSISGFVLLYLTLKEFEKDELKKLFISFRLKSNIDGHL
jgi:putative peptidoglycan lipid II flippase